MSGVDISAPGCFRTGGSVTARATASDNPCDDKETEAQRVLIFMDAQAAIAGTLESWLPRLIASNDALEAALSLLRDLYLARRNFPEDTVLRQVEDALNKAAKAKSAF
jgi:hypothetical protein